VITEINTKQDMSRWTRAHEKVPGIRWSVFAGPGGTMIIVEHEEDPVSLHARNVSPDALGTVATLTESADSTGRKVVPPPWRVTESPCTRCSGARNSIRPDRGRDLSWARGSRRCAV
jgi:hypothetical protein